MQTNRHSEQIANLSEIELLISIRIKDKPRLLDFNALHPLPLIQVGLTQLSTMVRIYLGGTLGTS